MDICSQTLKVKAETQEEFHTGSVGAICVNTSSGGSEGIISDCSWEETEFKHEIPDAAATTAVPQPATPVSCPCSQFCSYHVSEGSKKVPFLQQRDIDDNSWMEQVARKTPSEEWLTYVQSIMEDYSATALNRQSSFCRRRATMSKIIKCPLCSVQKHHSIDRMLHVMRHITSSHGPYATVLLRRLVHQHKRFVMHARQCVYADAKSMCERSAPM